MHFRREIVRLVDKIYPVLNSSIFKEQYWLKVRPFMLKSPIRLVNDRNMKKIVNRSIKSELLMLALGESCGFQNFYYSPSGADSSLFQPLYTESQYKIEVKSLDCILTEHGHSKKRIRFLKLEAEGGELEILKGAIKSLPYIDFIGADLGFEKGILQESTAPEVIEFLLGHGFSIVEFTYPAIIRILFRNNLVSDELNHHNGSLR